MSNAGPRNANTAPRLVKSSQQLEMHKNNNEKAKKVLTIFQVHHSLHE